MKQSEITPEQLQRQKIAGFIFPILLGWFLFAWVVFLITWATYIPTIANQKWFSILGYCSWFLFVPVSGFSMGVVNFYCWKNQPWTDHTLGNNTLLFLVIFWLVSFPVTIFLFQSCLGWIILPLHVMCFCGGQNRGKTWIETDALKQFFGQKSGWERDETD